jgi:hypothetical protein
LYCVKFVYYFIIKHPHNINHDCVCRLNEVWSYLFLQTFFLTQGHFPLDSTMPHIPTLTSYLDLCTSLHPPPVSLWEMVTAVCWNTGSSSTYNATKTWKPKLQTQHKYLYFQINVSLLYKFYDNSVLQWRWLLNMITQLIMSYPKIILFVTYSISITLKQCSQPHIANEIRIAWILISITFSFFFNTEKCPKGCLRLHWMPVYANTKEQLENIALNTNIL